MPLEWIERYDLPSVDHEGWAVIHIDSRGFLGIVSDYGNYAFHWRAFEGSFKDFLASLNWHYLHCKLAPQPNVYDPNGTADAILKYILSSRRSKELSAEDARREWIHFAFYESEIRDRDASGFGCWLEGTELPDIDASQLYTTMPEPQCKMFCQKVWPRFVEAMKAGRAVQLA